MVLSQYPLCGTLITAYYPEPVLDFFFFFSCQKFLTSFHIIWRLGVACLPDSTSPLWLHFQQLNSLCFVRNDSRYSNYIVNKARACVHHVTLHTCICLLKFPWMFSWIKLRMIFLSMLCERQWFDLKANTFRSIEYERSTTLMGWAELALSDKLFNKWDN